MKITLIQKLKVLGFTTLLGLGLIACGGGSVPGIPDVSVPDTGTSSSGGCTASTSTTCDTSVGGNFTGTIDSSTDEDWWRFTPSVSGAVTLYTSGTSLDSYCRIRGANGTIFVSDDDSGTGLNCSVTISAVVPGTTYYADISGSVSDTGSYTGHLTQSGSGGGSSTTGSLRLNNNSSYSIDRAYVRRDGSTSWGTDQMSVTVSPGGSWTLGNIPCGEYWEYQAWSTGDTKYWQNNRFYVTCGATFTETLID